MKYQQSVANDDGDSALNYPAVLSRTPTETRSSCLLCKEPQGDANEQDEAALSSGLAVIILIIMFCFCFFMHFLCFAGVGMGRLRVHHQPHPPARVCAAADAALQQEGLHR